MLPTRIDISDKHRVALCDLLNKRLADAIDLQSQTKQAHWTVRGDNFHSLHLLFDSVHNDVRGYVDLIAERIAQLGGQAEGTIQAVASATSLKPYPVTLVDSHDHLVALSDALGDFANKIRKAIDKAEDLKDTGTSDMFTEISRGVDSWLWMVESHLLTGMSSAGNSAKATPINSRRKAVARRAR